MFCFPQINGATSFLNFPRLLQFKSSALLPASLLFFYYTFLVSCNYVDLVYLPRTGVRAGVGAREEGRAQIEPLSVCESAASQP